MTLLRSLPLVLLLAGSGVFAEPIDIDAACLDCHRPGQARGEVPVIEGQQRDYLRNQLTRFRERHRDSFPMSALSAGLDAATVERLAAELAARPWQSPRVAVAAEHVARGAGRTQDLACAECHGERFLGAGDIPRLAGQQPGYLGRQLQGFGEGDRFHPPTGIGTRMYALEPDDARNIAAFLHSLGETTSVD